MAVLFALSIAPLTFLVGAALDYSGAANLKTHLQKATDGTGLALCQVPNNPTQSTLLDVAGKLMTSYFGTQPYTIQALNVLSNPRSIEISTKADFSTAVVKAMSSSFATVPVTAYAKCFGEPQTFEIALVLDNTGSMALSGGSQTKIQALRTAATNFVNFVFADPGMSTRTKISLVPFAASVAVPTSLKTASWVDTGGNASYHWNNIGGSKAAALIAGFTNRFDVFTKLKTANSNWDWNGCFEKLPYPMNTQDIVPTPSNKDSYYVPLLAPDEAGEGGEQTHSGQYFFNSYIDDSTTAALCLSSAQPTDDKLRTLRACKYAVPKDASATTFAASSQTIGTTGPNFACNSRPMTRLTTSQSTLLTEISSMQPAGTTDIHEGFMWGWRSLSPSSVLADGDPYTKAYNNKIIILMTDGDNTWLSNGYNTSLKSFYSAAGYYVNADGTKAQASARLVTGTSDVTNDTDSRAALDALTIKACQNATAQKVIIYTVGFSTSGDPIDAQSIAMLKTCAGDPSRAFVANDSTALVNVFKQIAQSVANLRLTK